MLRHFREETEALAINREVACFFTAHWKPVAIKIERSRLQIVGGADDAQRSTNLDVCTAPAGNVQRPHRQVLTAHHVIWGILNKAASTAILPLSYLRNSS
ncbi:hypothetical protein ATY78_09120 [Rhizobium sp. R635]|nr:hypothetical protein ATY78_09120 [Rhizobium sp. R635]